MMLLNGHIMYVVEHCSRFRVTFQRQVVYPDALVDRFHQPPLLCQVFKEVVFVLVVSESLP